MALSIQHEKNGGWGFVIRDAQGAVIRAGAGGEDFLLDAFHSEIIACHAGLKEAARVGLQNIWLETDATQVQMALMTDDFRLSAVGGIITEMKFLISILVELTLVSVLVMKWHMLWPRFVVVFPVAQTPLGIMYLRSLRVW
jgi:hypothetical protein